MAASESPPTRIGIGRLHRARAARHGLEVDELAVELGVRARPTALAWRRCTRRCGRPRRSHGTPRASNSSFNQPTPSPSSTRPPDSGRAWPAPWPGRAGCAAARSGCTCRAAASAPPRRRRPARSAGPGWACRARPGSSRRPCRGTWTRWWSGRITCSPPHTDSKPAASARRQISRAATPSMPMLLAKASPNFIVSRRPRRRPSCRGSRSGRGAARRRPRAWRPSWTRP